MSFHVDGQFDPSADAIRVNDLSVESTPVDVHATGTVSDLEGECLVDVDGELRYDVDRLMQSLAADFRSDVQVEGLRTHSSGFMDRWPHLHRTSEPESDAGNRERHWDLSRLNVEADVNWDRANAFGVQSERAHDRRSASRRHSADRSA